jgi:hypothetical protein
MSHRFLSSYLNGIGLRGIAITPTGTLPVVMIEILPLIMIEITPAEEPFKTRC